MLCFQRLSRGASGLHLWISGGHDMSIQPMAEPFKVRGLVRSLRMAETSGGSQGNLSLPAAGLSLLLKVFSWWNQAHSDSFPFWLTQNDLSYLHVQNSFTFCHILRVRGKGQILLILNGKGLWKVSTAKGRCYELTWGSMFFSCVMEVFLQYQFYHEWMLNFTRCLFCIDGDHLLLIVHVPYLVSFVKSVKHFSDQPNLVMIFSCFVLYIATLGMLIAGEDVFISLQA